MKTFCPECGFGVKVDEDGCCVTCGCDAVGAAVDQLQHGKIIRIEKCTECRWWDWDWCYHPDIQTSEDDARAIDGIDAIPSWCPLEDATMPRTCSCKTVIFHKGYICKDCHKAVEEEI